MLKNINDNCESVRILIDIYQHQNRETFEITGHLKTCLKCRKIRNNNLKLKKILKRAVEKDFAPQHLIDSIKMQIRR